MDHRGRVHSGERTPVEHLDLAATALFGGRTEHGQRDAEIVDERAEGHGGPGRDGRDDIVSACMAKAGQCVVFGAQGQMQRPASTVGAKRRGQAHVVRLDGEPGVVELTRHPRRRFVFLPGDLGILMQIVGQPENAILRPVPQAKDRLLQRRAHKSPGTPYEGASVGSNPRVR